MSKFVGYTQNKSRTPWQIGLTLFLVLIVVFFLWIISLDPVRQNEKSLVVTTTVGQTSTTKGLVQPSATTTIGQIRVEPASTTTTLKQVVLDAGKGAVIEQKFSKGMKNHQPGAASAEFSPGEKVYYYTVVNFDHTPREITHVWINPAGEQHFALNLTISRKPGRTWSMITLPPQSKGKWTAKVMLEGRELARKSFTVK
ncbi:MAG: DUF2914 domain-containing protein [bacterium]|nr:DUF2914 domain-containing protein [Candidatus Margulisiibacteriota bacterium]